MKVYAGGYYYNLGKIFKQYLIQMGNYNKQMLKIKIQFRFLKYQKYKVICCLKKH